MHKSINIYFLLILLIYIESIFFNSPVFCVSLFISFNSYIDNSYCNYILFINDVFQDTTVITRTTTNTIRNVVNHYFKVGTNFIASDYLIK